MVRCVTVQQQNLLAFQQTSLRLVGTKFLQVGSRTANVKLTAGQEVLMPAVFDMRVGHFVIVAGWST